MKLFFLKFTLLSIMMWLTPFSLFLFYLSFCVNWIKNSVFTRKPFCILQKGWNSNFNKTTSFTHLKFYSIKKPENILDTCEIFLRSEAIQISQSALKVVILGLLMTSSKNYCCHLNYLYSCQTSVGWVILAQHFMFVAFSNTKFRAGVGGWRYRTLPTPWNSWLKSSYSK